MRVHVAHPYADDVAGNVERLRAICRAIVEDGARVTTSRSGSVRCSVALSLALASAGWVALVAGACACTSREPSGSGGAGKRERATRGAAQCERVEHDLVEGDRALRRPPRMGLTGPVELREALSTRNPGRAGKGTA